MLPAFITFIVGYILIKYPIIISMPTDRGMHENNIASSGGIALLIGLGVNYYLINSLIGDFTNFLFYSQFFFGIALMGFIGFLDDKYSLTKMVRFGSQILTFTYIIFLSQMSGLMISESLLLSFILVFMATYTINIYNFMDGIDQLATMQAIFLVLGFILIGYNFYGIKPTLFIFIAFFLINFPRTKLFLGNTGSYILGFFVAFIIIETIWHSVAMNYSIIPIFILMTVFYVDTTYTILVRFFRKFNDKNSSIIISIKHITNAHRTHSYQKLAIKLNSHSKTVLLIMLYNLIWCLPLAYLASKPSSMNIVFLLMSYLPYIYSCYINKAGIES